MVREVVIIGGGHNALVTACYLAKSGFKVKIFEKSDRFGGLCKNEEVWPGIFVSPWANWGGMLQKEIIDDLSLSLSYSTLNNLDSKDALFLKSGAIVFDDFSNLPNVRDSDLQEYQMFYEDYLTAARILKRYFLTETPTKASFIEELGAQLKCIKADEITASPYADVVKRYIKNEHIQNAIMWNSFVHPLTRGSSYSHIYMNVPYAQQEHGWCFVEGGLESITQQLIERARSFGVELYTHQGISRLIKEGDKITALETSAGQRIESDIFISGVDFVTLTHLLGEDTSFLNKHCHAGLASIHIKLKRLPRFKNFDVKETNYPSSMVFVPLTQDIEDNFETYINNKKPKKDVVISASLSKDAKTLSLYPDYIPRKWSGGDWTETNKKDFFNTILKTLSHYTIDFHDCIDDYVIFTPDDLARKGHNQSFNCFHQDLSWEYAMEDRMALYGSGPKTNKSNLYVCSASAHPGGTVSGAPGYRCAHHIIKHYC